MTAAEIAFKFLMRGLQRGLCLSRFATLALLAAEGVKKRAEILEALGLSQSSRNSCSVVDKLVELKLVSRSKNGRSFSYEITPLGLRVLGIKKPQS